MMADVKKAIEAAEKKLLDNAVSEAHGCVFCAINLPRLTTVSDQWIHRAPQGIVPCTRS